MAGWEKRPGPAKPHHDHFPGPGAWQRLGLTREALPSEILRRPPEERVGRLGQAWDTIAADPQDVPIPEWHVRELEPRLAELEPKSLPWEEVRDRLRSTR